MKTNQLKKLSAVLIAGGSLSLAACNGGGSTAATSGGSKAQSLHAMAKKPIFSQSSCLSASFSNGYGSDTTLTVANHCGVTVNMDKHPLLFVGLDNHGQPVEYGYHGSQGIVHEEGNWNGSTVELNGSTYGEPASTAYFKDLVLNSGRKVSYDIPVQADPGAHFDQKTANETMFVIDADAPAEKADGIMFISIDTTKAGCNVKTNNCEGLQISINDEQGTSVQSFIVPKEHLGEEYIQPVDGLYNNQKYMVSVLPIDHTKTTITPKTITLSGADITHNEVDIKVTKDTSVKTGTVKITLPSVLDSYTGTLHVNVVNTKAHNEIVAGADLKQGKAFNVQLPVSDASHEYVVQTSTGLADLAKAKYFVEGTERKVEVKSGKSEFTIPMVENKPATHPVTVKVTGLATGDNADVSFQDLGNKYSYASTKLNASTKYEVESGLTLGISASVQKSKIQYANGVIVRQALPKTKTVNLEFHTGKNPEVQPEIKSTNQYKWSNTSSGDVSKVFASADGTKAIVVDYEGQIKLFDVKSNKATDLGYQAGHFFMGNIEQQVDVNWVNNVPHIVAVWNSNVQYFDGLNWKALPSLPSSTNLRVDKPEISVDWSNSTPRIAVALNQYDIDNLRHYGAVYLYNQASLNGKWDEVYSGNHEVGGINLAPNSDKAVFVVNEDNKGSYLFDDYSSSLKYYDNGDVREIGRIFTTMFSNNDFVVDWSKGEPRVIYEAKERVDLLNVATGKATTLYKFDAKEYAEGPLGVAAISAKWEANDANVKAVIAMENGTVEYAANGRTTELFAPVADWNGNFDPYLNPEALDPHYPFGPQIRSMKVNWNSNSVIPNIVVNKEHNDVDSYGWYTGSFHPELYGYNSVDGNWYTISNNAHGATSVIWGQSGFADKIFTGSPLKIATLK